MFSVKQSAKASRQQLQQPVQPLPQQSQQQSLSQQDSTAGSVLRSSSRTIQTNLQGNLNAMSPNYNKTFAVAGGRDGEVLTCLFLTLDPIKILPNPLSVENICCR